MDTKFLVSIVGPTGIGKTSLSIGVASYFKTEIVSTDSRQFYKEMSIGTAAPSQAELKMVPHHFIHSISIHNAYSVGTYESEALALLDSLFQKHSKVVLVGGSGLFHTAIVDGLDQFPDLNPNIREHLNRQLRSEGISVLQEQLKELDPISYKSLDLSNPQRVIRALEVCIGTGKPFSTYKSNKKRDRYFQVINIGLMADREVIYERINQRVDLMIKEGLIEEARNLHKFKNLNALNTVGYKELFDHFEGNSTLEEAIAQIKMNTRRFAKRQLTWFRKDDSISWFDYRTDAKDIIRFIEEKMSKKNPA